MLPVPPVVPPLLLENIVRHQTWGPSRHHPLAIPHGRTDHRVLDLNNSVGGTQLGLRWKEAHNCGVRGRHHHNVRPGIHDPGNGILASHSQRTTHTLRTKQGRQTSKSNVVLRL